MHQLNPNTQQLQVIDLKPQNKENHQSKQQNDHNNNLKSEFFKTQPQSFFLNNLPKQKRDPQNVENYIQEIMEYTIEQQKEFRVNPNYMEWQKDIDKNMRQILIDWLIDVSVKFKLLNETVFIAVNLIDRYLQE